MFLLDNEYSLREGVLLNDADSVYLFSKGLPFRIIAGQAWPLSVTL